jgi:hypothetical protein
MSEQTREPELAAMEAALRGLAPAPAGIDRDRLMFLAGQARRPRAGWLWPCATAALALLSAGLTGALVLRPTPEPVERIVFIPSPSPEAFAPARDDETPRVPDRQAVLGYFQLRDQVLNRGLDGLPELPPAPPPPPRDSLDNLLGSAKTFD